MADPNVAAGGEQQVTGGGFAPGEIVLVAIDDDTRYEAVADREGRITRRFPVYDTAAPGAHTVDLTVAKGGRSARATFSVQAPGS
ncbi:hypothetical protein ACH429_03390 [Streptomyces pathocidini]|uniref:Uncharacterized protein n=2 Tax=Streptomyces pathocidini TaxID=1650571 RepID=A0ABW7UKJ3_9ACTN